jgi:ankyrin repeat protein
MNDWYEKEQLHFAAQDGDLTKAKELIEAGYDVNAIDEGMELTPLHYAVREEKFKVAEYLISAGAEVNAHEANKAGETPLGDVAETCSYEMAEFLINNGANPTIPGWMQLTALDRAKNRKNEEGRRVYDLLLEAAKSKFNFVA